MIIFLFSSFFLLSLFLSQVKHLAIHGATRKKRVETKSTEFQLSSFSNTRGKKFQHNFFSFLFQLNFCILLCQDLFQAINWPRINLWIIWMRLQHYNQNVFNFCIPGKNWFVLIFFFILFVDLSLLTSCLFF